jgi:UDP-N-acetylglucosamine--N-acetylmuramyl-(pentapeptide) pyrophosphoryl-undecaprenol N-acetylglucosamine transferase
MAENKLVIIGAGGTGGHMFPASSFAHEMKARGWRVGLISDVRGLRYADQFPADWTLEVQAASPNMKKPWTLPGTMAKLRDGRAEALKKIAADSPALAAGFGGYPAFPLLSAARAKHVPILIHEQNAVLGRVNRRFAKEAAAVACGFDILERLPEGVAKHVTGNPVRPAIRGVVDRPLPPTGETLNLLITGGSQGARILGEALPLAIIDLPDALKSRLHVVQQVREEQVAEVVKIYANAGVSAEIRPFFDDMAERLSACHMFIGRAGAGTVSEIAAVGRPSILIPLAIAMDDHQTANASALVDVGAADLLLEDNLYPKLISELLAVRLGDSSELKKRAALAKAVGHIDATRELADLAERVGM